jgi:hypothetical protein
VWRKISNDLLVDAKKYDVLSTRITYQEIKRDKEHLQREEEKLQHGNERLQSQLSHYLLCCRRLLWSYERQEATRKKMKEK